MKVGLGFHLQSMSRLMSNTTVERTGLAVPLSGETESLQGRGVSGPAPMKDARSWKRCTASRASFPSTSLRASPGSPLSPLSLLGESGGRFAKHPQ